MIVINLISMSHNPLLLPSVEALRSFLQLDLS